MAVYVFVVCMYVSVWLRCGVVWWVSSLWIVAGMVVVWQDSRVVGEAQGKACNCKDADGLGEAIAGQPIAIPSTP